MRRKKVPKNRILRKKLVICMTYDGEPRDTIDLLLGYSLSREMKHLMREHSEILTEDFWKLYQDDVYREKVVQELLKKYESQISQISLSHK